MLGIIGSFVVVMLQMYSASDTNNLSNFQVSLTLFSGLAILLVGVTIVNMVICMVSFGKGLKDHINHSHRKEIPDPEHRGSVTTKKRFSLM